MSNFQIAKLLFTPTGTYNDQYLRPYYMGDNVDSQVLSMLQESTRNGRQINAGTLSGLGGMMLKPSADIYTQVQIANGFGEQRLRFMMEVHSRAMGANLITYVSGYTDYPGYHRVDSQNTVIDPNLKLYFDKSVTIQHLGERTNVIDSSHLLFGAYNPSFNASQENVAMAIRPEDIFSVLEVSSQTGGAHYADGRLVFADQLPKKSKLVNEIPNHYAASVMSNFRDSVVNGMGGQSTMPDAMQYAIGNVAEGVITEDPLFHAICKTLNFNEDGSITYGALCSISPGLDNVTAVAGGQSQFAHALHNRGSTANWNAANGETLAAIAVATQVPALMSDLFLTGVVFVATNDTFGGEYIVDVKDYHAFAAFDMTRYIEMFKQRLIGSVLRGLSHNSQIKFSLTGMVDMHGETWVKVSMQGGPAQDYCAPTCASALFAPVLSYNKEHVFGLVSDFETIARNLDIQHHAPQTPQNYNVQVPVQQPQFNDPMSGHQHNPWEGKL